MCADDVSGTGQISEQIGGPIAYLTSEYPKVSHTFILREIEARVGNGFNLSLCQVPRIGRSSADPRPVQRTMASDSNILGLQKESSARSRIGV